MNWLRKFFKVTRRRCTVKHPVTVEFRDGFYTAWRGKKLVAIFGEDFAKALETFRK